MKKPLISVIIPMYNTGSSCQKMLESILANTYQKLEIIVVDDGSTDDSFNVIKKFSKKYENIIVKQKTNGGASSARNLGLTLAKGEWISFLDSDDLIEKTFYQKLVDAYADGNTIIAGTGLLYRRLASGTESNDYMKPIRSRKPNESIRNYALYMIEQDGRLYGVVNKLFRRDIIEKNKIRFDEALNFAEDTKFMLAYLGAAIEEYPESAEIKTIYEPLYIYNYGTETSTIKHSGLDWKNWKLSYENLKTFTSKDRTLTTVKHEKTIYARWRVSHALAVARSDMNKSQKRKYAGAIELTMANLILKVRK